MRCRKARKLLGEYIDGELPASKKEDVERHLAGCPECLSRERLLRGLLDELASLPQQVLSPHQEARLKDLLGLGVGTAARTSPRGSTPMGRWPGLARSPLAIAAAAALILTAAGLSYGLLATRNTSAEKDAGQAMVVAETPEAERGARFVQALVEPAGEDLELPVEPVLDLSGQPVYPRDLEDFTGDVPVRLQFFSTYWYPLGNSGRASEAWEALKGLLLRSLAGKVDGVELSDKLEGILEGVMARMEGGLALPCYVAYVLWEGKKPAWLISLSTPGDALWLGDIRLGLDASTMVMGASAESSTVKIASQEGAIYFLYYLLYPDRKGEGGGKDSGSPTPSPSSPSVAPSEVPPGQTPSTKPSEAADDEVARLKPLVEDRLQAISSSWGGVDLVNAWESGDYEGLMRLITSDWRGFCQAALGTQGLRLLPRSVWVADASTGEILHFTGQ
ncbi:MAG: zf-HC2 domain-containing protein [Candidatus Geothermincolales bacterium]